MRSLKLVIALAWVEVSPVHGNQSVENASSEDVSVTFPRLRLKQKSASFASVSLFSRDGMAHHWFTCLLKDVSRPGVSQYFLSAFQVEGPH